ncbi:MAG: metal-dependent transcriptional regulator [Actinobacteria bacterium]|nr:metal-dependent transcriptional regulator [Actinomycetota bacterium]
MSVSDLSLSTQNYLKAIWTLGEWSDAPVTPSLVAERTGLKLSSVSDAMRKLSTQGLVEHAPYGAVTLTEEGHDYAVAMVRRHRLIESFLVEVLGYAWDEVHDEAETLEHAVSDFMVARIDSVLGFPTSDPHGDPIPSADGTVTRPEAVQLSDIAHGEPVAVIRISDADPALLQFFRESGIGIGTRLVTAAGAPFSESVEVRISGQDRGIALGRSATDALYVSAPGD